MHGETYVKNYENKDVFSTSVFILTLLYVY